MLHPPSRQTIRPHEGHTTVPTGNSTTSVVSSQSTPGCASLRQRRHDVRRHCSLRHQNSRSPSISSHTAPKSQNGHLQKPSSPAASTSFVTSSLSALRLLTSLSTRYRVLREYTPSHALVITQGVSDFPLVTSSSTCVRTHATQKL